MLLALLLLFVLGLAVHWWWRAGDQSLDDVVGAFMAQEGLPGAVIAARDAAGRSLLRAYGLADPATGRPVRPDTAFRLASLSKPITAAAIQVLVDRGDLRLDDRLVDLLPLPPPRDPRVGLITVRQLLQHTAGWDRGRDIDPLADSAARQRAFGQSVPRDCGPVAVAMLGRPLQFDPGSAYAYSNLGYCFLELILARRTDSTYAAFVAEAVLAPRRVEGLRLGEAGFAADALARPVAARPVLTPAEIVLLGGAGGWVGPAAGILGFVAGPVGAEVAARPSFPVDGPNYYGLGWRVWPAPEGATLSHFGAIDGSFTVALRLPDGLSIVVLFNARPGDDDAAFARLRERLPAAVRRALSGG